MNGEIRRGSGRLEGASGCRVSVSVSVLTLASHRVPRQSALFIQAVPVSVKHTRVNQQSRVFAPLSMSLSSTNSTITSPIIPSKRRRVPANQHHPQPLMDDSSTTPGGTSGHIPKRGARACTACRKGKNRCEGEVSHLFVRPRRPPSRSPLARLYRPGPESINRPLVVAVN